MMRKIVLLLCVILFNYVHAQFTKDFRSAPFPQNSCNNLQGNYVGEWLPTHGTPYANNYNRLELKVKDAGYPDFKIKTEGVFIDLTYNGLNLETGNKYRAEFYYQKPSPETITFKAYLTKNMSESSNSNCGEDPTPTKSSTKVLYDSRDFLSTTYTNQVVNITVDFTVSSNDYKYLWIHSDHLSKYSNDKVSSIYFTKVSINYNGANSCSLNPPSSRYTNNITEMSAKLNWSRINGNRGYQYQYRRTNSTSWTSGSEDRTYKVVNNLNSNTEYEWRIRTKCSNGLYGQWSSNKKFTTLSGCLNNLSISATVYSSQTDNQSAQSTITATNVINSAATVNYDAGGAVFLKPGFYAKPNSNFRAYIEGCTANRMIDNDSSSKFQNTEANKIEETINIYPNPTKGRITIESKKPLTNWYFTTMYNKTLIKGTDSQKNINIANFEKGIYFLKIVLKNGEVVTKKVIKN